MPLIILTLHLVDAKHYQRDNIERLHRNYCSSLLKSNRNTLPNG